MLKQNINNYTFIILLTFFLFLQLTLIPQLFFDAIHPNLVLTLLIAASFLSRSANVLSAAFFCGSVLDIFSGIYFGPMLISFLLTIFISSYFGCRFLKELFSIRLFLISIATVLFYNSVYFILININNLDKIINNCKAFFSISISEMIYTALLIVPLLLILSFKINIVKTNEK
ncbi:MAG: rod shape-determining protein MreD [Candidatus Pacebacteria bacterium]|nr:rod shape-determining protein MreD [Candidatus Paceibacterota bacterium]